MLYRLKVAFIPCKFSKPMKNHGQECSWWALDWWFLKESASVFGHFAVNKLLFDSNPDIIELQVNKIIYFFLSNAFFVSFVWPTKNFFFNNSLNHSGFCWFCFFPKKDNSECVSNRIVAAACVSDWDILEVEWDDDKVFWKFNILAEVVVVWNDIAATASINTRYSVSSLSVKFLIVIKVGWTLIRKLILVQCLVSSAAACIRDGYIQWYTGRFITWILKF